MIIEIRTDNAAFGDNPAFEVGRILRRLAERIEGGEASPYRLMDFNGNTVGEAHD